MRQTLINGRWPITLPDHRADFHEARPWWEAARLADMAATLRPGDVLYDIGAECGDLTALYSTWGCDVHAFEPQGLYWPSIWQTQRLNSFRLQEFTHAFVADFKTWVRRELPDKESPIIEEPGFAELSDPPTAPVIRLDDYVRQSDVQLPDAITMDIEGGELAALRGAQDFLSDHSPVLWVSIHVDVNPLAEVPSPVHAFMRELGYDDQFLAYDHEWHYRFFR